MQNPEPCPEIVACRVSTPEPEPGPDPELILTLTLTRPNPKPKPGPDADPDPNPNPNPNPNLDPNLNRNWNPNPHQVTASNKHTVQKGAQAAPSSAVTGAGGQAAQQVRDGALEHRSRDLVSPYTRRS